MTDDPATWPREQLDAWACSAYDNILAHALQASPRRKAHQRPDFASWERATLNQWAREAAQRIGDIERLRSARRRAEAVS